MKNNSFIYQDIAGQLEQLILSGALRIGDRLPSVRQLSTEKNVSISSIYKAYIELESKGLIEARPKSGYYVRFSPQQVRKITHIRQQAAERPQQVKSLQEEVYAPLHDDNIIKLSINKPDTAILPVSKLKNSMLHAIRQNPGKLVNYNDLQGHTGLRRQIARVSYSAGLLLNPEDIITTTGCLEAIHYALLAVTAPGDAVAVESPTYFGLLKAIETYGRIPVEVYTDPISGIDIPSLEKCIDNHDIKACIVISSFSNPTGAHLTEDKRRGLVSLVTRKNIVLIEDDIYGELFFGQQRLKACKAYDLFENVILCSSFSKSVAPGYRIGWLIAGRYKSEIFEYKMNHSVTTVSVTETAMAHFLENGRYDLHMRQLRKTLHVQCLQYLQAIHEFFPDTVKISAPEGGFVIWVAMPDGCDSVKLYRKLIGKGISIAPGQLFSRKLDLQSYFRISFGSPFTPDIQRAIGEIGAELRNMM